MPQLRVLGGGKEVGRVCLQLDINQHHFLLDCGISPALRGRSALPHFNNNIQHLDAVFVSHAHLDHTGAIPNLVRQGFKGKIFMTLPTLALLNLLWQDELSLMEREWPPEERLWSSKEMHTALMKLAEPTTYHEVFKLNKLKVNFHNAGHILGSTMTEFLYNGFRIIFSGDLGTSSNHLRYWRTDDLAYPDVLICEGTYGGKNRKGREELAREFVDSIRAALERGGKVLIPIFAVGKTQEVLKILKDNWNKLPNVDIYLEGMSIETLRVYEQFLIYMDDRVRRGYLFNNINPFRWEALKTFKSLSERRRLHLKDDPCIIMAPSGMLRGGWSVWHMIRMASSEKNLIGILGHMEKGTVGYDLINNVREFKLFDMITRKDVDVKVKCEVSAFEISAHAMHNELCNYISRVKPEKLVLVHGEEANLLSLAESVKQHTGEIIIPSNGDKIDLQAKCTSNEGEKSVEIPISEDLAILLPASTKVKVKLRGKIKYAKSEDLKSLAKNAS
ncbi:MAG: MBL fold metallo-hydrolase [Candidatus Methanomethyliales bacterium]|nr:MBL fold metallo-hydrolase [Candidatus Methanomethylicales archaeon]